MEGKKNTNILLPLILTILFLILSVILSKNLNILNKTLHKQIVSSANDFIYDIGEFYLNDNNLNDKMGYDFITSYTSKQKSLNYKYNLNQADVNENINPFNSTQFASWKIEKLDIKRVKTENKNNHNVYFDITFDVNCYDFLPAGSGSEVSYDVTNGKISFKNLKIIIKEDYMDRNGNMVYQYEIPEKTSNQVKQLFLTWDGRNPYNIIDILKDKKTTNRG
jgi:hypothetical protein